MMQEEDGFDLPPTPEDMADVENSFPIDSSGPTLLVAASSSSQLTAETENVKPQGEEGPECSIDKTQTEVNNMTNNEMENESSEIKSKGLPENGGGQNSSDTVTTETESKRKTELFAGSDESGAFLVPASKPNDFQTASTLFGNADGSADFLGKDERANSFTSLIKPVEEIPFNASGQHKSNGVLTALDESFQGLSVAGRSKFPSGSFPTTQGITENANQHNVLDAGQYFKPSNVHIDHSAQNFLQQPHSNATFTQQADQLMPENYNKQSPTTPNTTFRATSTSISNQGSIQMFYNPQNLQQQFNCPLATDGLQIDNNQQTSISSISNYSSSSSSSAQNGVQPPASNIANVGNSYMYTSPISSVIPGYEKPQSTEQFQNQPSVKLQQSHVPKQPAKSAGELFVPDLYGHSSGPALNRLDLFTPALPLISHGLSDAAPTSYDTGSMQPPNFETQTVSQRKEQSGVNPYHFGNFNEVPFANQDNFYNDRSQDPGFWEWVKNQHWSEEAQRLGKQILQKTKCTLEWFGTTVIDGASKVHISNKNATETVLTTLDPGMEEYLNPLVHLAIASQDSNTLKAVRQGFKNVFGHTAAKGVGADNSFAKLPIGFEFAMKGVIEKLDAISTIDFKFNQPYVHIAMQPFLTELQQGRWSCMFCMAVRDSSRQIQLQTFSQPIQIPSPCIAIAYNKTSQEVAQYGFGIDIEETVRLYQPFGIDQDWCSALTGIKLETIISLAAQGLASDYKRELENPSITNVDSFVIMQ